MFVMLGIVMATISPLFQCLLFSEWHYFTGIKGYGLIRRSMLLGESFEISRAQMQDQCLSLPAACGSNVELSTSAALPLPAFHLAPTVIIMKL